MIPAKIAEINIIGNTTIPSVKIVLVELIDSSLEKLYRASLLKLLMQLQIKNEIIQ